MNKAILMGVVIFSFCPFVLGQVLEQELPIAPKAKKTPQELKAHGDTRIDNYFWLKERENPEVIAHLEAENAYTQAVMKSTEGLQEKLYQEMIARLQPNDSSVPYFLNGYYYYTRYEKGQEYPLHCRKKGSLEAKEEIMLDVNKVAEGQSYCSVSGVNVSPNNEIVAYGVDTQGRRLYDIRFKNLKTGKALDVHIPKTGGSVAWANDNKTVFYAIQEPETLREYKIFRYSTEKNKSEEVFHEKDETYGTYVYQSKSRKYIIIGSYSTVSTEYRVLNANDPVGEFRVIQTRERDLEYSVYHYQDHFYILTNWKAKNFRLMKTPIEKTSQENWKEVIAHKSNVLLEDIEVFRDYLVVSERRDGLTELRVVSWEDNSSYDVEFNETTYSVALNKNPEFNTSELRFEYTSMTTPASIFQMDMSSQKRTLLKQQIVLGDFDSSNYQAERHFATARDGTKVPISLVYRKGRKEGQPSPLLLYSYGSYGYSMDPYFSSVRLSLLNRGFVYAIAHIRGGQEMGRYWYEEGKLLNKKNTFTDFIDCGKYLIEKKYTTENQLFAQGGSAGGLLMGAVINMQPDLFRGAIADVPFVDVVTTMLDDSIPLTTFEYDEWGNPNVKEYYQYMLSYSPYDNVEAKNYPALLVTTGLHDSQVQYWEPAKWVAKLRDLKTDKHLLLLQTDMKSGHGGASGRYQPYRLTALQYAFLLKLVGLNQ